MWRPHSNWLLGHDDSPGCVSRARPQAPLRCLTPPQRGRQGSTALFQLAWAHAHETILWASKSKSARHTFNYDLINGPDPNTQISSVWRIPTVPIGEKSHGRHPTQKPLRLLRRAVLASTVEGALVFDPFSGSGTTGVAAKELGRFFAGAEMERGYAELAGRRIGAAVHGEVLRNSSHPKSDG